MKRIRTHQPRVPHEPAWHEVLRLTREIPMWSGPRHSPVPVIAPAGEQRASHIPQTCRDRGLKAKLCDPNR